jgi:hypothetical protein
VSAHREQANFGFQGSHLTGYSGLRPLPSAEVLGAISEKEVQKLFSGLADHLEHVDRAALKQLVSRIMERIELNPETMECRLHYRINAGEFMASPRGTQELPAIKTVCQLRQDS